MVQDRRKVVIDHYRNWHTVLAVGTEINAIKHCVSEHMGFSEPTSKI